MANDVFGTAKSGMVLELNASDERGNYETITIPHKAVLNVT